MRNRLFVICCLYLAYAILLAHALVPHHHHDSPQAAAYHHLYEHTDHHHDHEESQGHEHTAHFVHDAEFGSSLINPAPFFPDFSKTFPDHNPLNLTRVFEPAFLTLVSKHNHPPERPPGIVRGLYRVSSFRGPPSFIS